MYGREEKEKGRQHPDFPGGHPPEYYPSLKLLDFADRTGYGIFSLRWPSTSVLPNQPAFMQTVAPDLVVVSSLAFATITYRQARHTRKSGCMYSYQHHSCCHVDCSEHCTMEVQLHSHRMLIRIDVSFLSHNVMLGTLTNTSKSQMRWSGWRIECQLIVSSCQSRHVHQL